VRNVYREANAFSNFRSKRIEIVRIEIVRIEIVRIEIVIL